MLAPIQRFPVLKLTREKGPLYQKLADLIRGMIERGELELGSELPKEAEIEAHLGVSLITVRRALRELEDLGLIQKRSAKPAMVTAKNPTVRAGRKFGSLEDLIDFTTGAELVIEDYRQECSPVMEKYFGLAPDEPGWCLRGQLRVDSQPRTIVTSYFPPDVGSRMSIEDFSDVLIFKNVARCLDISIERVLVTARAEIASKFQASMLQIKPGSAMLTTELVYLTNRQRTVEVTINSHSSEHLMLSYDISLGSG